MTELLPELRHAELLAEIRQHDYRYYVLDDPTLSDQAYDALMRELRELETRYPRLVTADSPTQRVAGEPRRDLRTVEHVVPMMSLDNTYSPAELREFVERVRGGLSGTDQPSYCVEPKLDGASVELVYRDGTLVSASTRGDGQRGEEILENLKTIRGVPLSIPYQRPLTLRGEVVIYRRDLERINAERLANGDAPFANPRTPPPAASGCWIHGSSRSARCAS